MTDFANDGHRAVTTHDEEREARTALVKRLRTLGLIAALLFAVVALWGFLATRSYTLTIGRGDSLISALNDRYHPTNAAQGRKVYLKSVAIAEACGIPLYERPLGGPSMRFTNYNVARARANSTDWTMVRAPMFAGDEVRVGLFKTTCTAGPGTKPFTAR